VQLSLPLPSYSVGTQHHSSSGYKNQCRKIIREAIGSLPKFVMPAICQAMILNSIWFATKTYQTLKFGLLNLWQFFCPTFGLPNIWHDKFWKPTKQSLGSKIWLKKLAYIRPLFG